jgi:hypothetical protein
MFGAKGCRTHAARIDGDLQVVGRSYLNVARCGAFPVPMQVPQSKDLGFLRATMYPQQDTGEQSTFLEPNASINAWQFFRGGGIRFSVHRTGKPTLISTAGTSVKLLPVSHRLPPTLVGSIIPTVFPAVGLVMVKAHSIKKTRENTGTAVVPRVGLMVYRRAGR